MNLREVSESPIHLTILQLYSFKENNSSRSEWCNSSLFVEIR